MITDDSGNKTAQPKIGKLEFSKNLRTKRITRIQELSLTDHGKNKINRNICPECGFRIRSENHCEGDHHKDIVPICKH